MREPHKLTLICDCGEPFHLVHFHYEAKGDWPEYFSMSTVVFYGSPWQRLKKAVKLLCKGWVEYDVDTSFACSGQEPLKKLKTFVEECLEETEGANEP